MAARSRRLRSDASRNRELLIETARQVFAEIGIDAPLDLVARRAGVGNATLYRHFPSRDALVVATFRLDLARNMEVMEHAMELPSAWDGLVAWLRFCFHEQATNVSLSQALSSIAQGLDTEVDRLREATREGIQELISRAKSEGSLRADRELDDVLLFVVAHAELVRARDAHARAVSERWLVLTIDGLRSPRRDV